MAKDCNSCPREHVVGIRRLAMSMIGVKGVALAGNVGGKRGYVPHSVVCAIVYMDMPDLVSAENVRTTGAQLNADVKLASFLDQSAARFPRRVYSVSRVS